MSFYIITDGITQIEHIFIGRTEEEVVNSARNLINQWHEYESLQDDEIIKLAKSGDTEFDLVEINSPWPGDSCTEEELIAIYEQSQA